MKVVTYRLHGEAVIRSGVVQADERVLDVTGWMAALPVPPQVRSRQAAAGLEAASGGVLRWLQSGSGAIAALGAHVLAQGDQADAALLHLKDVELFAPVPRPGKIIGVGRNYADHAKETGVQPFEAPRIIFKMPSAVAAPGASVVRPADVRKMDFESELAVVIGGYGKDVPEAEALSLVAGYTLLNDLSAREFQFDVAQAQTTFAKSMDGFSPMGPWLVTADEIPDPQTLDVSCWLNGKQMQHGHTADMLFPVATLIAYLSRFMTLEPGDVIATGTPAGVGAFRKPPVYLQPGDELRLEVSRVGSMTHRIA